MWKIYRISLMATIANMGAAYGYTITVWTAGMLAETIYKQKTVGDILIHAGGYILAYALLVVLLFRPMQTSEKLVETSIPSYAFLHLFSVPAAVGVAYVTYYIIPWPLFGYGLGGFLSGLAYNAAFALQMMFYIPKKMKDEPDTWPAGGLALRNDP